MKGLKIHRARTKCGAEQRQKERTVTTVQTEENHKQEEHHSVEDLLPTEATQIDIEEEQCYPNQTRTPAETSTDNRKQRIQWPPTDDKRWESFDEDLDKILGTTLTGDVHRMLSSLSTIVYAVGQERFGTSETRDRTKGNSNPNRRQ